MQKERPYFIGKSGNKHRVYHSRTVAVAGDTMQKKKTKKKNKTKQTNRKNPPAPPRSKTTQGIYLFFWA